MTKSASSAENLIEAGVKHFNAGEAARADDYFSRALTLRPADQQTLFFRAHARHSLGRRADAWRDLRAVLGKGAGAAAWLAAADFHERESRLDRALRACSRALAVSTSDFLGPVHEKKGDLEARLGRPRASLSSFRRALAAGGRSPRLELKAAQRLEALGDFRGALVWCRRAGTDEARLLAKRLGWRLWIGDLAEKVPAPLREAAEAAGPGSAAAWSARAEAELSAGLAGRAESSLRRAISKGAPLAGRLRDLQARRRRDAAAARLNSARELARRGFLPEALKRCAALPSLDARLLEAKICLELGLAERAARTVDAAVRARPRDPHVLLKAAELHSGLGRQDRAVILATAACRADSRRVESWLALAEAQAACYLEEESRRSVAQALPLSRQASEMLRAAAILHRLGSFPDALKALERACRASPDWAEPWARRAQLELWEGRLAKALSFARRARSLTPGHPQALRAEAGALVLSGRAARALPLLERALLSLPRDAEALTWKGEALKLLGRPAAARRALEAACAGGYPLAALFNLELLQLARGKAPRGATHEYITTSVPAEIAPLGRGDVTNPARYRRNLERALRALKGNRSLDATFRYRGRLTRHVHFFPRGLLMDRQALLRFGDARTALLPFERILRETPLEAYPYSHRAEIYLWLGRYGLAEKDFRRALALNDALLWPKIGIAAVALLRGKPAAAVERLEYAAGRGGSDSILSNWWGEALRRLGRPREALARLARIPERLPYRPAVWLNVALCRLDVGQAGEARRLYAALRRAVPEFLAAAERAALSGRVPKTEAELRLALETALGLMRGNRSSWFHSFYQDGRPRVMRLRGVRREKAPAVLRGYPWAFAEEQ